MAFGGSDQSVQQEQGGQGPAIPTTEMVGYEFSQSRTIQANLQRETFTQVLTFDQEPEVVLASTVLPKLGAPHGRMRESYLVNLKVERIAVKEDVGEAFNATTQVYGGVKYTSRATLVYEQRPCLLRFEEFTSTSMISVLEWYDRQGVILSKSREGRQVLQPQRVYRRHWPKLMVSAQEIEAVEADLGTLNEVPFRGLGLGGWMFDVYETELLYKGAYDVTIGFTSHPHFWKHREARIENGSPEEFPPDTPDEERYHIRELYPMQWSADDMFHQSDEGCWQEPEGQATV